ncbi:MAG TPA: plastocyanin/azurin family copper-binding protein [Gaiellaceae bacterium]|nr:plastocyanin/azurin family copper-binding protein [Gaiellaceae bacterium]
MTRARAALSILLVVCGLAAAGCGGNDAETGTTTGAATEAGSGTGGGKTLNGSVGPGFDISLDGTDGVTTGSYELVVNDQSTAHNFHLTGPGVDVSTEVGAEGEKTFEIDLQAGEYTFQCDPHASQMNGSFTVG